MPLYFSEKEIVLPGQLLSDNGRRSGEGTYVLDGKVYAAVIGLATIKNEKVCVIPLKGVYNPQVGDKVIGIIAEVKPNGYEVSLGKHLFATVKIPDKREVQAMNFKIGDVIYGVVKESGLRGVFLETGDKLKKITSGLLIMIHPSKIPRLIGRRGSMINMLKKETGCELIIGKNGYIVIRGDNPLGEFAALSAIKLIEREAHSQGLTERVGKLIKKIMQGAVS
ncbi:MAG: exosome complex protein Rrp4 [Nitrososphaerota archaeon]|nr:exosome complex protein Rrp4 [Candidatus Geocrenenecus dongiae]